MVNILRKLPCRLYRYIWVIPIDFHSKLKRCVRNQGTDGSKSDNAKLFACDFTSGKCFLCLFRRLCNVFIVLICFYPVNTAYNITGCQKQSCKHQFFYTVCIGSRCVEDNNPLFCAFIQWDVVNSRTGSSDYFQLCIKFHFMHSGTSYQNSICILNFFCLCKILS